MYLVEMVLYILRATKLEKAAATATTTKGIDINITEDVPKPK